MLVMNVEVGKWVDMTTIESIPAGTKMRLFVVDRVGHGHCGLRIGFEMPKSIHILRSNAIVTEAKDRK